MSGSIRVAKPAGPTRPTAPDVDRGTGLRDCDTVEIPIGILRYLQEIAESALRNVNRAEDHMERAIGGRTIDDEERIRALAKALNACDLIEQLHEDIDRLIPEGES